MKPFPLLSLALASVFLMAASCKNLDIRPEGDPDRFVIGTVNFSPPEALPPGTVVTIRVLDTSNPALGPMTIGEQKIENPGGSPIAFKVAYTADDALLRRGLNIDAYISVAGKRRYATLNSYAVTSGNALDSHEIWVSATGL